MPYIVQPIDPEKDNQGLSQAMMTAFIQDPHWALLWPGMSLEQIIDGSIHRLPQNLISGRERKRYQKVIETGTGEIVGYSRWLLPPRLQGREAGGKATFWPEAEIPEPTPEQREHYEAKWKSATVEGRMLGVNQEMVDALSPRLEEEDVKVKGREEFLGKSCAGAQSVFP